MKAIILARVSDGNKQDSNEAQIGRISDVPKRFGVPLWKTYEIEESSTKGDRMKFQEVVKDIETSKEEILLVVDTIDRLQRSFKESVILDDFRKAGKLQIHFYRENLTLNKESNSSDLLRWDMGVMFARSYVLQLSDNVKRKQDQMLKNGEFPGRPPIGYKSIYKTKDNGEKVRVGIGLDPEKAHFIRTMFELYASGNYSFLTVRSAITKEGLRSSVGTPIATSLVEHILQNPFYYGEMIAKGKVWPHKYDRLITRELFDRCEAIRKGWGKKPFQYAAKPAIFRGLIRCAKCGCALSPETAKGKYVYYACTNAKKEICDKKIYVPEKVLLEPIYEVLKSFSRIPQAVIDEVVEGLRKSNDSKDIYHKDALVSLRLEYDAIQIKISRMTDLLLEGTIQKDDYDIRLKSFKERQREVLVQIEDHTNADEKYYITASNVLNLAKNALKLFESSELDEKRALLNYLLQNSVAEGKKLTFELRSPFNTILALSNQPIGLLG